MFRYGIGFCLVFVAASVVGEETVINEQVDSLLEGWNKEIRSGNDTIYGLLADSLGENIHYSDGFLYGLDSLARTGDCKKTVSNVSTSYDCHFGLRLLLLAFPNVTIDGESMSLYVRVRNNSFHLGYTVVQVNETAKPKYVVDAYEIEAFEDVELGASNPRYDDLDVNEFFRTTVKAAANAMVKETLDPESSEEDDEDSDTEDVDNLQFKHLLMFRRKFN